MMMSKYYCYHYLSLLVYLLFFEAPIVLATTLNGGTYLALTGKNCVIMASDSRFSRTKSSMMIGKFPREIYRIGSKSLVGASGLDYHYELLVNALHRILQLQSDSLLEPDHIANCISSLLYEYEGLRRFVYL